MRLQNYRDQTLTVEIVPDRNRYLTPFGRATLKDRYTLEHESYQEMFARVAAAYSDDDAMAQRIYDYISKQWLMPSTPILSNGGTDRGMPISCFLNSVQDSMTGIAKVWNENVWLASRGGGIGTCWSDVRSMDEPIGKVGKTSGVIPFIRVQDSMTLAVSQGSLRRGSAAVYLDVSHPEIEEFLEIRKPTGDANRRSLNLHHGVCVPDAFMEAVIADRPFDLVSPKDGAVRRTVSARHLWQKILTLRVETGEPYIVFSDTVNRKRPASYEALGLKVTQSNLCSEISLHTGLDHKGFDRTAVCCLSSLNLAKMDEWFGNRQFLRDALLFLDNVLSGFIKKAGQVVGFENAVYSALRERSIGLGVMGFHSYLQQKRIPFESAMAKSHNLRLFKWLHKTAGEINLEVSRERGPCPDARDANIEARWTHMFAVAPTASISIIAGGVSPSVEPWAANVFTQKTLSGSFVVRNPELDALLRNKAMIQTDNADAHSWLDDQWRSIEEHDGSVAHLACLTDDEKAEFRTFMEIDQRWVVSHAADRAGFIDQMASNNLCVPADIWKKELHLLHLKAWREGVKSLYYLRSKSLQRATKVGHMAGEMPQPDEPHRVILVSEPLNANDYESCLACQ